VDVKTVIYLLRLIAAIIGGTLSGIFKYGLEESGFVMLFAAIVYLVTIYIAYFLCRKDVSQLELKTIFLEGGGSYIIFWLMLWILFYNLLVVY
jgi:hypothetical protein